MTRERFERRGIRPAEAISQYLFSQYLLMVNRNEENESNAEEKKAASITEAAQPGCGLRPERKSGGSSQRSQASLSVPRHQNGATLLKLKRPGFKNLNAKQR